MAGEYLTAVELLTVHYLSCYILPVFLRSLRQESSNHPVPLPPVDPLLQRLYGLGEPIFQPPWWISHKELIHPWEPCDIVPSALLPYPKLTVYQRSRESWAILEDWRSTNLQLNYYFSYWINVHILSLNLLVYYSLSVYFRLRLGAQQYDTFHTFITYIFIPSCGLIYVLTIFIESFLFILHLFCRSSK